MGIDQEKKQIEIIEQYDLIVNEATSIYHMPNLKGYQKCVYDHWKTADGILLDADYIDYMIEIIKLDTPEIYEAAINYLYGTKHRGFNCYIMKSVLFDGLNKFQFKILKNLGKYVKERNIPLKIRRTYAFIAEILYGIYIEYLIEQKDIRLKSCRLY